MHSVNTRGITILELVVVIAIIAMLAAFMIPAFQSMREKAKFAVCVSNLREIGAAIQAYAIDFRGMVPYMDPNYCGEQALIYNHERWGLGLLVPYYIPVEGLDVFQTPMGRNSVLKPETWATAPFVVSDTNYWQYRAEWMFEDRAIGAVCLSDLIRCLLVSDEVSNMDWQGFTIHANHTSGFHYLSGGLSVGFVRHRMGLGIPTDYYGGGSLKEIIRKLEQDI